VQKGMPIGAKGHGVVQKGMVQKGMPIRSTTG